MNRGNAALADRLIVLRVASQKMDFQACLCLSNDLGFVPRTMAVLGVAVLPDLMDIEVLRVSNEIVFESDGESEVILVIAHINWLPALSYVTGWVYNRNPVANYALCTNLPRFCGFEHELL